MFLSEPEGVKNPLNKDLTTLPQAVFKALSNSVQCLQYILKPFPGNISYFLKLRHLSFIDIHCTFSIAKEQSLAILILTSSYMSRANYTSLLNPDFKSLPSP